MIEALRGKHALVTGGGRGIGLAAARALSGAGARVSIVSRTAIVMDGFSAFRADVSQEDEVAAAFAQARAVNGSIAVLVNNSGIAESAPLHRTHRAMWDRIIAVNLTGTYLCTRAVLEEMRAANWGRIVNVASIAGLHGAPYVTAYTASKHGVMGLTRSLAAELEGSGVSVSAVCPGYTETEMMEQALRNIEARTGMSREQAIAQLAKTNSSGRIVTAQEVGEAILDLCVSGANGKELTLPPLPTSS